MTVTNNFNGSEYIKFNTPKAGTSYLAHFEKTKTEEEKNTPYKNWSVNRLGELVASMALTCLDSFKSKSDASIKSSICVAHDMHSIDSEKFEINFVFTGLFSDIEKSHVHYVIERQNNFQSVFNDKKNQNKVINEIANIDRNITDNIYKSVENIGLETKETYEYLINKGMEEKEANKRCIMMTGFALVPCLIAASRSSDVNTKLKGLIKKDKYISDDNYNVSIETNELPLKKTQKIRY